MGSALRHDALDVSECMHDSRHLLRCCAACMVMQVRMRGTGFGGENLCKCGAGADGERGRFLGIYLDRVLRVDWLSWEGGSSATANS